MTNKPQRSSNFVKISPKMAGWWQFWIGSLELDFLVNILQSTTFDRSTLNLVIVCMTIKPRTSSNFMKIEPKMSNYW